MFEGYIYINCLSRFLC